MDNTFRNLIISIAVVVSAVCLAGCSKAQPGFENDSSALSVSEQSMESSEEISVARNNSDESKQEISEEISVARNNMDESYPDSSEDISVYESDPGESRQESSMTIRRVKPQSIGSDSVAYYHLTEIVSDKYELSLDIPEDLPVTITDFELWCDNVKIGERTSADKKLRNIELSMSDYTEIIIRLFNENEFVADCPIDPTEETGMLITG